MSIWELLDEDPNEVAERPVVADDASNQKGGEEPPAVVTPKKKKRKARKLLQIDERFRELGIVIPFPQRDVHFHVAE